MDRSTQERGVSDHPLVLSTAVTGAQAPAATVPAVPAVPAVPQPGGEED